MTIKRNWAGAVPVTFASAIVASAMLASTANAQLSPSTDPVAPPVVPNPTYVVLKEEVVINRPAKAVWARVGKFCDVGEWAFYSCSIVSGKDGELGAVRLVAGRIIELLAGKTDLSYTYVMPVRVGTPYNAMHGTLEAKPLGANKTLLIYSHVYDNSVLADDAMRIAERAARQGRITRAAANMKILAEGGKLTRPAGR